MRRGKIYKKYTKRSTHRSSSDRCVVTSLDWVSHGVRASLLQLWRAQSSLKHEVVGQSQMSSRTMLMRLCCCSAAMEIKDHLPLFQISSSPDLEADDWSDKAALTASHYSMQSLPHRQYSVPRHFGSFLEALDKYARAWWRGTSTVLKGRIYIQDQHV